MTSDLLDTAEPPSPCPAGGGCLGCGGAQSHPVHPTMAATVAAWTTSPEYMGRPKGALPDLRDPATAGCLLALLGMAASRVSLADGTDLACLSDHPVSAGPPPPMTLGEVCVAVALRHRRWLGGGDR